MNWITFIWSMSAGICLTLGAVHFVVWIRRRYEWATLVFSMSAAAAAGYAFLEVLALHAQTPADYGALWQWTLAVGMLEGVLMVLFIRLYLQAGRPWLLWLICGLRALMLVLNFVPGPNFFFREISSLQHVPLLGEVIARPHGGLHPWVMLMPLSFILIIIFAIDAAHTASKQSGRTRSWVLGGLMAVGFSIALVSYALYARGALPSAFSSQLFLLLILLMGYELSQDVLRAGQLSLSLQQSEERMSLAAQAANLGMWIRDLASDEIWASDRWREMFGFTQSQRLNVDLFMQRVHPDDRERIGHLVTRLASDGIAHEVEYRVVLPNGQVRWIGARGGVERDGDGRPVRVRGVSVDITGRKRAEAENLNQRAELAHVTRVSTMGQLASSLAHELNQPLGAILRNAEAGAMLLEHQTPDLEEIRAIFADICKDNHRAGAVIERTRSMLQRRPPASSTITPNALVEDVLALAQADAVRRRISVRTELTPGLPPLRGDSVQLQQVLLNLMLNGMDAMNDVRVGERRLVVRTRRSGDKAVEISVSDTGSGIPPDQLSKVLQPFFTTKPGGLGMGLAISRTIVEAHGGRLWAENNPDGGATVRFTLSVPLEGGASS